MILLLLFFAAATLHAGEFSTYVGDENTWQISRLIVDASGNTYVAGSRTFNLSFDPLHPDLASEAIVAKLDATGKTLLVAGLGGKGNDSARDVALDRAGNIYVAGVTTSPNFPVRNALYPFPLPSAFAGAGGSFLAKLTPDGSEIIYATYFPGAIARIAVDSSGAVYAAGTTTSPDFPVTPGLPAGKANTGVPMTTGAFLTKISPAGDRIVYSTVILGHLNLCTSGSRCFLSTRGASGAAVALDAAGNAYLAGNSDVADLPTTPGVMTPNGVGAFVAKVNAAGTVLAYLSYIGTGYISFSSFASIANTVTALAVDAAGNAYVTGRTWDPHLAITAGVFQTTFHGWKDIRPFLPIPPNDAFAMKLNPSGTAVVWGSYLGGDAEDGATNATLDSSGNLWVAGSSISTEFPNLDGWSTGQDFIVEFNPTGGLQYSARYPGGTVTPEQTLAVDSTGLLHTATPDGVVSAIVPSPHPAVRPWTIRPVNGHIAAGEVISIFGPHLTGPVLINDFAAPILYASDQQMNVVVPFEIAGQTRARIRVGSGPEFNVVVLAAVPQIFTPALNENGTINSPDHPARVGSVMSVWVTGTRSGALLSTGQIATGALEYPVGELYADSIPVRVLYEGAAPGLVAGIGQINFVAPDATSLVLISGKYASAPVPIYVRP